MEAKSESEEERPAAKFSKEIEEGFKSVTLLKMENMIDNIKKYHDEFRGAKVPYYERRFIEYRKWLQLQERKG